MRGVLFNSVLFCALSASHASALAPRQSIIPLTSVQIATLKPYAYFASAAYCSPSTTLTWTCGANCKATPDFIPVASGGNGNDIQYWFVGYAPSLSTVVVSHQGTDISQLESDLTDIEADFTNLDSTLFPGVDSSVEVHEGFANEQAKTAATVLAAVQETIYTHGASQVTIVGHSLGAAIALLDGVYLPLHLGGDVTFKVVGYGLPRVGNQEFANYIDGHVTLTHINNKEDPIPIVPGRFLGYHHPSGEIHIQDSGAWLACPGQDNPSIECIVGDVPNIFDGSISDHDGPYDGVEMGC